MGIEVGGRTSWPLRPKYAHETEGRRKGVVGQRRELSGPNVIRDDASIVERQVRVCQARSEG